MCGSKVPGPEPGPSEYQSDTLTNWATRALALEQRVVWFWCRISCKHQLHRVNSMVSWLFHFEYGMYWHNKVTFPLCSQLPPAHGRLVSHSFLWLTRRRGNIPLHQYLKIVLQWYVNTTLPWDMSVACCHSNLFATLHYTRPNQCLVALTFAA